MKKLITSIAISLLMIFIILLSRATVVSMLLRQSLLKNSLCIRCIRQMGMMRPTTLDLRLSMQLRIIFLKTQEKQHRYLGILDQRFFRKELG